jgi:outer membrane protein assembly factor BamB
MYGNCPTQDGRSRVPAPTAPRIVWQSRPFHTDRGGIGGVYTDAVGHAYVMAADSAGQAAVVRLQAADGAQDWRHPFRPAVGTGPLTVLDSGAALALEGIGDPNIGGEALFAVDVDTGAASRFGPSGLDQLVAPAPDGTLFGVLGHGDAAALARLDASGAPLWSTALSTLDPAIEFEAGLTLGHAMVVLGVESSDTRVRLHAVDANDGTPIWQTSVGLAAFAPFPLRANGDVVVLEVGHELSFDVIDGATGAVARHAFESDDHPLSIVALTSAGAAIVLCDVNVLCSIDETGVRWRTQLADDDELRFATVSSNGIVVGAAYDEIYGVDADTGALLWQLVPPGGPSATACAADVALASDGTLVGVWCDGTVFGARD